jgi:GNAT superfamily N-acetyltransferase
MSTDQVSIRPCVEQDCKVLVDLIRELAVFEKLGDHATATPETLRRHMFGPRPLAEALLAEISGKPGGFALFFHNFSTFRGQPGIYLEDLFVRSEHRGLGIGKALLQRIAQIALERDCARFEWAVLDWNTPAMGFYQKLGAVPMDDWTIYRLQENALLSLARGAPAGLD